MQDSQPITISEQSHLALPADLQRYLDEAGRVIIWPSKRKTELLLLAYLAAMFEPGRLYREKEVNQVLACYLLCNDYATVRRDLCDFRYLKRERDGSSYWRIVHYELPLT